MREKTRMITLTLTTALLFGCSGHPSGARDSSASPGADSAPEAAGSPAEVDTVAADRLSRCEIPEGFSPSAIGPGFPQVVTDGVETARASAQVLLGPEGTALVRFEVVLENKGDSEAGAKLGFVWRTRGVTRGEGCPEVGFEGLDAARCVHDGPREVRQPHTDIATTVDVVVPPGSEKSVKGAYKIPLRRFDKPETLFGYEDRFSRNWKNWDWPYTKSDEYAPVADSLRPYVAAFTTIPAGATQVTLAPADGRSEWLRAMSFEQNVTRMRKPGTYRWSFEGAELPGALRFEYAPGLEASEELKAFEAIAAEREGDLRARIRLADLHLFAGDTATRVQVLEQLLDRYEEGAKEQMLEGSNDVRLVAHVALVRSLLALRKEGEAKKRAGEGLELVDRVDMKSDMNHLAAAYLKKISEK